ncbi:aminoacyl-histidine dipeptidase [Bacteroidota bacterium]
MEKVLQHLEPQKIWINFEKICEIPHPSTKEQKLADFVKSFGEELNLETLVDDVGNILIRKPATKGLENRKTVILQAHLDMVPQKNRNKKFDFDNDPIDVIIDGEWIKANETTLGADNGVGVAAIMAVLESNDIEHGPIEGLFTIDEETGMTGAFGLEPGFLQGDILLNLDSEDEGELYIGCAGGMDTTATLTYHEENVPENFLCYKLSVTGLKGGHSGMDINKGRGNAIKIMGRILWEATKNFDLRLIEITGGGMRNAIPREAFAVIAIPKTFEQEFQDYYDFIYDTIKSELEISDPIFTLDLNTHDMPEMAIDFNTQKKLLAAIYACPNGVIRHDPSMPSIPETSSNLAIINTDSGRIEIQFLLRSSIESAKDDLGNMLLSIYELTGAEVAHSGEYPGWRPNIESEILGVMKKVYNDQFGKDPEVKIVHAGLECGVIGDTYPNLDMISFGPTIVHPHSPDERVEIRSVQKFWQYLLETLKSVPER